jgi:SpoVK/Ycf46/Vps4 family AAA+-type ATPase
MADTLAIDPGLQSRFSTFINFPNYTTEEMLKIFEFHCRESNHFINELNPVIGSQSKGELIKEGIAKLIDEFKEIGNGRAMRKLLEKTERIQSIRLYKKYFFNGACTSKNDFLPDYAIFSIEDILLALSELRLELLQVQAAKQDKVVGF